jgi:hypothetical protein
MTTRNPDLLNRPFSSTTLRYRATYQGGHPTYSQDRKVDLHITPYGLEIPQFPVIIPYNQITELQQDIHEKFSWRLFLLTRLPLKEKQVTLALSYTDGHGKPQTLRFTGKQLPDMHLQIYRRIYLMNYYSA